MTRAMRMEAMRYPGQEQQVFEFFRQNPRAAETLRGPMFEEKVVDFILELAKVEEKTVTAGGTGRASRSRRPVAGDAEAGGRSQAPDRRAGAVPLRDPLPQAEGRTSEPTALGRLASWSPDRFRLSMRLTPT